MATITLDNGNKIHMPDESLESIVDWAGRGKSVDTESRPSDQSSGFDLDQLRRFVVQNWNIPVISIQRPAQAKWQRAKMKENGEFLWVKCDGPRMITCEHINGQKSTLLRYETNVWAWNSGSYVTVIPARIDLMGAFLFGDAPKQIGYGV